MHNVAPTDINAIEIKSNLVKISLRTLDARMELKTMVSEEVEVRVIMSANARLAIRIYTYADYKLTNVYEGSNTKEKDSERVSPVK